MDRIVDRVGEIGCPIMDWTLGPTSVSVRVGALLLRIRIEGKMCFPLRTLRLRTLWYGSLAAQILSTAGA